MSKPGCEKSRVTTAKGGLCSDVCRHRSTARARQNRRPHRHDGVVEVDLRVAARGEEGREPHAAIALLRPEKLTQFVQPAGDR
eukprot:1841398-Pyramimonas_sp.AAC.1